MKYMDSGLSEVEIIKNKCLESAGYLLFSASISSKRDDEGRPMIDFDYRRHHFTLEDAKQSLIVLRKFVDEEYAKLSEEPEQERFSDN